MPGPAESGLSGKRLADLLQEVGTVLLDTADASDAERVTLLFDQPIDEISAGSLDQVVPALSELDKRVSEGYWVAGFLSYEAGYAFERRFEGAASEHPLVWFGVYSEPRRITNAAFDDSMAALGGAPFSMYRPRIGLTLDEYVGNVESIRSHIRDGDVYQISYTFPYLFDLAGDPRTFYRHLRIAQPVPYSAYLNTGVVTCLSLSPELFFLRRGSRIVTRPMKGTAATASRAEEDARASTTLQDDPKNLAENLMIVDLLRNDLSRCCRAGSVTVPDLFTVTRYPSVLQMTSTVEGSLLEEATYASIFRALFPCGSVTGAPKIRAMELIRELEAGPRGIYCGAIGFVSPHDEATFSVAIRTITLTGQSGRMGVGSGIVWDSDPLAEFEECLLKTRFVEKAAALT